ncbi:MAG: hypothetical protein R3F50_04285 [Gammaproteobacteria bacterium]|jgi:hypothetical protein
MKHIRTILLRRTSFYTLVVVALLFALLPLTQRTKEGVSDDLVITRQIDIALQPPPPPEERKGSSSNSSQNSGINLEALTSGVDLQPLRIDVESVLTEGLGLGYEGAGLDVTPNATFTLEGVGFGTNGLDRQPILLVRPVIREGLLRRRRISQFEALVFVKWMKDGSLRLIRIEEIEYPEPEFAAMVRDAISQMRYTKPTVDGEPVERFVRLPITIHAG